MSRYTLQILPSAEREMAALPRDIRARVARKIDGLAVRPRPPGVKKLQGADDLYRVRVGDYRVIYRIQDRVVAVTVIRVRRRDKAC